MQIAAVMKAMAIGVVVRATTAPAAKASLGMVMHAMSSGSVASDTIGNGNTKKINVTVRLALDVALALISGDFRWLVDHSWLLSLFSLCGVRSVTTTQCRSPHGYSALSPSLAGAEMAGGLRVGPCDSCVCLL